EECGLSPAMCALPGLPRNTRRGEPSLHWQKGLAQLGGCDAWDVRPIARDARATKRSRSCYRREECDEAMAPCDCTPMARHRRGGGTMRRPAASRRSGCPDDSVRRMLGQSRVLLAGLAIATGVVPAVSRAAQPSATVPAASAPTTTSAIHAGLVAAPDTVACASTAGDRKACPANTSGGVALLKSTGAAPCLLGKSWGYDDTGVWVADGCSGVFIVGQAPSAQTATPLPPKESPEYIPNLGFKLYSSDKGQIYMRLFSYSRFLNQKGLDATYTDAFGNTTTLQRREDIELNKFFLPFSGWFISPKLKYYLYVWSANT